MPWRCPVQGASNTAPAPTTQLRCGARCCCRPLPPPPPLPLPRPPPPMRSPRQVRASSPTCSKQRTSTSSKRLGQECKVPARSPPSPRHIRPPRLPSCPLPTQVPGWDPWPWVARISLAHCLLSTNRRPGPRPRPPRIPCASHRPAAHYSPRRPSCRWVGGWDGGRIHIRGRDCHCPLYMSGACSRGSSGVHAR